MPGGTLLISRAVKLFPYYKQRLEGAYGFNDVTVTDVDKDGLNTIINDLNPRIVLMGSGFYQAGTPYMAGELLKRFPNLNLAVISMYDYPLRLAAWFIWHGAKSYVSLWEGYDEFQRGLYAIREGKQYISPLAQDLIEQKTEWPDTKGKITKRQLECLIMLCSGFIPERIGTELQISKRTVSNTLAAMYKIFHAENREEMVALAWELDLVSKRDIRFFDRRAKK
jgi:DNA-binding NarL/FixJ family response regulator